ncbi:hypothetical protein ACFLT5_00725 [Chloroflexota bacterium]
MRQDSGLLSFALILLLVIAVLVYFTPVVMTGNWLWFLRVFDTEPQRIVIYREGERFTLFPGDPGFSEVTGASNKLVSRIEAVHRTFGISDIGLEQLREEGVAVELYYREPLDFPTPVNVGGANQLLIPLGGHYATNPVAFRGFNGEYWGAALRLGDLAELNLVVSELER